MKVVMAEIGDYVDAISGPAYKSARFTDNPWDIPLVKGENISQGYIAWEKSRYWPIGETEEYERFRLVAGDIVLAMDRPWVTAGLKWARLKPHDPPSLLVQRVARLRAKPGLRQDFLTYVIGSAVFSEYVRNIMGGTNVPHISGGQIKAFKFPLPGQNEQAAIASTLSAYDDLIENNRRRIALLEEAARFLYREWFVHFRFPGHEHVKTTDGIPEGWAYQPVSCLANVVRGRSYRSSELAECNGQPFINLKCMRRFGGFRTSGLKWFHGEHKEHHGAAPGDIVIAVTDMTRDALVVAQAARVPRIVSENAIFSMDLVKAIPKREVESEWLYGMFRFSGFSASVREEATGATVLHLKPKHIEDWEVLVPSTAIRSLFSEQFGAILDQIDVLELQSENCSRARDLLLPRLMNGEIAV